MCIYVYVYVYVSIHVYMCTLASNEGGILVSVVAYHFDVGGIQARVGHEAQYVVMME